MSRATWALLGNALCMFGVLAVWMVLLLLVASRYQ